jgi:OOP family OmpA-OmpF porin
MSSTNRSLAYSAMVTAVLALASCSSPSSDGSAQSAGTPRTAAAQHRFNVYFDLDKSSLTPEARQLVAQVITQANRDPSATVIVLVGKTDIAGTGRSSVGPAQRRADTVRAALIAGGIAPDRISERSVGPQETSIPTPSGVREPRNRMVEIAFQ